MFSVLGIGFASGGLMIIVEIIFTKLTRRKSQRAGSSLCTILLLLTISSTLTVVVTIKMIDRFYDPEFDPCLLVNQLCEWEYQKENMSSEHMNICEIHI